MVSLPTYCLPYNAPGSVLHCDRPPILLVSIILGAHVALHYSTAACTLALCGTAPKWLLLKPNEKPHLTLAQPQKKSEIRNISLILSNDSRFRKDNTNE